MQPTYEKDIPAVCYTGPMNMENPELYYSGIQVSCIWAEIYHALLLQFCHLFYLKVKNISLWLHLHYKIFAVET